MIRPIVIPDPKPFDQTDSMTTNNRSNTTYDPQSLITRKGIRIPIPLEIYWNPDLIRNHMDSKEYGSNILFDGRSDKMFDQTKPKTIWLTKAQAEKWDPSKIKDFLYSQYYASNPDHTIDSIDFKKSFEFLVIMLNSGMKDLAFKKIIRNYIQTYQKEHGEAGEFIVKQFQKAMNSIRGQ